MSISKNILVVWLLIYGPIASALVQANDWPAFPADVDGRLFRVAGSNTVGANLMRNFLVRYFEAKGVSDIRVAEFIY